MGLRSRQILRRNKKGVFLSSIGWSTTFFSFIFLKCSGYEYVEGVKNYSDYSPKPFMLLPLLAGACGGFLIIKEDLRLAKQFENA